MASENSDLGIVLEEAKLGLDTAHLDKIYVLALRL
jgi:hypothetical protein